MRVDIYRRAEANQQFSYLAVPEGRPIPQEATNVDWQLEAQGSETEGQDSQMGDFGIDEPAEQIQEKGYAITSVKHLSNGHSPA